MNINDNPTVNRYLKDKAVDLIDHALGRPTFPLEETYRNHFATDADSNRAKEFSKSLHWRKTGQRDDMAFFAVTDLGRHALADHLKNLPDNKIFVVSYWKWSKIVTARSRSAARYDVFLDVSDSSDISFREFLKVSSVRAYA
nr:hypothetical protein [Brucella anthropi]DAM62868.1 MAG TPA: hypothetical protein [Caudoviricetes sp.]